MATTSTTSIQEAAVKYAQDILGGLNSAVTELVGVDVFWFRVKPDKRSQDVIFQSYTLFGVEDCPLTLKAVYSDSGYDDAAITYNIMGINFNVPMTLDVALKTWNTATNNDGTIPQKGDIVFIPMTRKLMEVVSMQPVKQLGGQLTSYKVNLSIYTPTRSRIVGEQLKDSIKNNTTNLMERFGEDIKTNIEDIVDDDQLSLFDSTTKDKHKSLSTTRKENSIKLNVNSIVSHELMIDGHIVSRNYYNTLSKSEYIVEYNKSDSFTNEDERCYSCWFRKNSIESNSVKNIKQMTITTDNDNCYINTTVGNKFKKDERIIIQRGTIQIPGVIINESTIKVNKEQIKNLYKTLGSNWINFPGFAITKSTSINLLYSDNLSLNIYGSSLSIKVNDNESILRFTEDLKDDVWYGIIINIGKTFTVDLFTTVDNKLTKISSILKTNTIFETVEIENYSILSSNGSITNIRLYNTFNNDIDKQLTDLVSYNVRNNDNTIINDSADTYLNSEYIGRQR